MKKTLSALAIVLMTASCSTDGGSPSSTPQGDQSNATSTLPAVSGAAGSAPTIQPPTGNPPKELVIKDVIEGTGAQAAAESTVTVHYSLMAWSTGQPVESSWGGDPATFGLNQVIVGWQQGIPGMKVGGRRLLVIPPDLAYGESGAGSIGPNETLVFVVDLIAIS